MFCEELEEGLNLCATCQDFVFHRADQVALKMEGIVNSRNRYAVNDKSPEEFKMMVTYTLYCTSVVEFPTLVHKAIQAAGSEDNIKLWCFPTPDQRQVHQQPKVVCLNHVRGCVKMILSLTPRL